MTSREKFIADLHCHYPMHVFAKAGGRYGRVADYMRGEVIELAAELASHPHFLGGWRATFDQLAENSNVHLVLSVLYSPFAELDLGDFFGADAEASYYDAAIRQLDAVEAELEKNHRGEYTIVRSAADLEDVGDGKIRICHAIEGGFHLGRDPDRVEGRVAELARRGVAYITLAHLIPRRFAANAPALPFLTDHHYDSIFHQRIEDELPPLGEVAVRAMHRYGVAIDISHMREDAIKATFELVEKLDRQPPKRNPADFPVLATHAGFRFGTQSYMLSPETIRRIARRQGLIGLIMAQHQLNDGRNVRDPGDPNEAARTVRAHVEAIEQETGSYEQVAIGSDFDGFVKPTIAGVDRAPDLRRLRDRLWAEAYGVRLPAAAIDGLLGGNVLRVMRRIYDRRG